MKQARFNSFFVYSDMVYGSIYTVTSHDFMDGADSVCSFPVGKRNERIARLLDEMSGLYRVMFNTESAGYKTWSIKRFHSYSVRLESIVGKYAYAAIMDTCELSDWRESIYK